jgi:capsular exopolysaccharide synthesis family protein
VDQGTSAPLRTLAVTSAIGGEGKTTVSAALAAAYARIDKKVLIVDGDLHRPRLREHLGSPQGKLGLLDVLERKTSLAKAVRTSGVPGLTALTTEAHPQSGDLLARRLQAVLEEAKAVYDLVVVDCPPVLATDDARTVTLLCDATLLVIATGTESTRVVEAAASLDGLKVNVLGAVLNRSRLSRRQGMGSYGAYG